MKLHIFINRRPIIILKTLVNICLHVIMHAYTLVVVHIRWNEPVHLWFPIWTGCVYCIPMLTYQVGAIVYGGIFGTTPYDG